MTTPALDLTSAPSPALTFYYYDSGGSDAVGVSASTDGTTFTTLYTTATSVTPWTQLTVSLSAYQGNSAVYIKFTGTSVWGSSNPHIDDVNINSQGSYVTSTWLTGTPPSTIAGGDSGNVSLTFNASSFSSDTSLSATVSVYNNDPQDTLKTFAATMNVRADTAIFTMGLAGKTLYHTPVAAGDTSRKYTINIQNTGVRSLVIDSAVYVGGQNSKFFNTTAK